MQNKGLYTNNTQDKGKEDGASVQHKLRVLKSRDLLIQNCIQWILRRRTYQELLAYPKIPAREAWIARSIILRHLDCGSCHGCELALMRLENPVFDLQKYNIRFEPSPSHAYYLVMTGPITKNMVDEARRTANSMPIEAIVAFGDCAIDGGPFKESYAVLKRDAQSPSDPSESKTNEFRSDLAQDEIAKLLHGLIKHKIPGCPPAPFAAQREFLALPGKLSGEM